MYKTNDEITQALEKGCILRANNPVMFKSDIHMGLIIEYVYLDKLTNEIILVLEHPHFVKVDYAEAKNNLHDIFCCNLGNSMFEILLN